MNLFVILLAAAVCAVAQIPPAGEPGPARAPEIGALNQPLAAGGKVRYSLTHTFAPSSFLRTAIGAGIDQWRDHPEEWGDGAPGYVRRYGSSYAKHMLRHMLILGTQLADGEDPRSHRLARTGFWNRTKGAIETEFFTRNDDGRRMFRYSEMAGDFGSGILSRYWFPQRFHTIGDGLDAGASSVGVDVGLAVLREFAPDIKRRLLRR